MSFFEFPHTRTYDSDLGWLIKNANSLDDIIKNILSWIDDTQPTINDIQKLLNTIEAGNLPDGMKEGIKKWMDENAIDLVGNLTKMVLFNITDDGYFIAYIPESWNDITFNTTGLDIFIPGVEYGHLTLSY